MISDQAPLAAPTGFVSRFDRPIFIVSTPRSGSTLLFETLERAPGLFTVGGESHWLIEDIAEFDPAQGGFHSNRLTREDARPEPVEKLAAAFLDDLKDREGKPPAGRVRMLEKTPKNALRVEFFDAVWPQAEFVYLYRDVRETLASMMEAWASGAFQTYPQLPGWTGYPWSLLLVPGWEKLRGRALPEVVAHQWAITTNLLLDDLARVPSQRVRAVDYARLVARPQATAELLAASLGLAWDQRLDALPLSKTTVSPPRADKWRRLERVIEPLMPIVAAADERARAFLEQRLVAPEPSA